MTTVYLLRHSEGLGSLKGEWNTNDSLQLINEKSPLSINGEKLAEEVASMDEFKNLDSVWCSNYVRTISTAKYFAEKNGLKVNLDDRLGERVHGVNSWNELPENFEEKQFQDETFKVGFGENQLEVRKRMEAALTDIINNNSGKRICIVSHATAIAFLLKKWCDIEYGKAYSFKGKEFFDGNWKYCETFKLEFDDNNNLIDIVNIKNGR